MPKTKISEFSATPANNTDIDSINIAEGCAPSGINDAIRELMSQLKDFQTGAVGDSFNGPVNGTLGATTPATASVTTLAASGAVTLSGGTANGVTYLNGSKVLTSGSALTFDGTNISTSGLYVSSATTGRLSKSASTGRNVLTGGVTGGITDGAYVITEGYDYGGTGLGGQIQLVTAGASSPITFAVNGTEGMRLTSTGLGIGTSSPSYALDVAAGTMRLGSGSGSGGTLTFSRSGQGDAARVACDASSNLQFWTNTSERARITAAGEFLLTGLTSPISSGILCIATNLNNNNPIVLKNTTTQGSGQNFAVFTNSSNAQAGAIQHSGSTSVTYSTSSDARLKTDLGVAVSTNVIDNTIIHNFEWKEDKQIDRGVFAQEAYEVKPSAVSVGNDELTEDGNLAKPWGVDYSKYVPDLIVHAQQLKKQVQEQQALIQSLKARLDAANL